MVSIHSLGGQGFVKKYGIQKMKELADKRTAVIRALGAKFYADREARRQASLLEKYGPSYMQILMQKMAEARAEKRRKRKSEAKLTP